MPHSLPRLKLFALVMLLVASTALLPSPAAPPAQVPTLLVTLSRP